MTEIFDRAVPLEAPTAWSDADQIGKLASLIALNLGNGVEAAQAAALGVLPHHANIPHGVRLSVEYAMKAGHARVVACTSTLAQGVNFPIKYLVVTATQQGKEKIKVRDFHNLMGRAGRAGMHTESSVIFSAPQVFDDKGDPYKNWRWKAAKELLDPKGAEPSSSSILEIFKDYQQTIPPVVLPVETITLDLAFVDEAAIEGIVQEVLKYFPIVSATEFRDYVRGRARAVQSVAMYLGQHIDFEAEDAISKVEVLAANTLAYHLADEEKRAQLIALFQATGKSVLANADAGFRALIKKSPLPPADLKKLNDWLIANLQALAAAAKKGEFLQLVAGTILPLASAKSLASLSDQLIIMPALLAWIEGRPFSAVRDLLQDASVRVSGDNPTAEHAVAICEDGFGYHLAMILASIVDLVEPLDEELKEQVTALQRQVKNGLSSPAQIAFYEAGFGDRVVAQVLAAAFPKVADRAGVRALCRNSPNEVQKILAAFPAYFEGVAQELGGQ